ncbi:MAG: hypothetical protein IJX63_04695 [Lachnospiraceae bacterium]|nr:hypothetical protein [Lachnospiraceae bacterium]
MKGIKKLGIMCVAVSLFTSSVLGVSAASLKDIFDADYYAEKYADVKAAFGDDEEALYAHYLNYGLKEGRSASVLFDVADYRARYSDLQAAFGDNWEAYAEHYLTYGLNEGRDGGGEFDAVSYANRYEDLKEAFGYDITALYEHYKTYGEKENRDARSQAEVQNTTKGSSAVNSGNGGSVAQPEVTVTPAPEVTATPVPEATATPTPEPTKIPVEVDLNGLAQAYSKCLYVEEECLGLSTTFGLYDITGDGIPELFSGQGADVITYWHDDYWFMFCDMVLHEWYYDEATEAPACYYYYEYDGKVSEELWFLPTEPTEDKHPGYWMDYGDRFTENIDLTQYTYINIHEFDKEANIASNVMASTLKAWMEAQEEYEYTFK